MKECCRQYLSKHLGDDMEFVKAVYAEYASTVGGQIAEAEAAAAAGEWSTLDKVAHAIKGNALTVGDQLMGDAAIELRSVALLQDHGGADRLVSEMKSLAAEL